MNNNPPDEYLPTTAEPAYPAAPYPPPPPPVFADVEPDDSVEHGSRSRWMQLVPRSLSSRLVVGVVSLVVVLVLATGLGTYFALRSFLLNRLDQQLTGTVDTPAIVRLLNGESLPTGGFEVPQKVWVEVLDKSGNATSYQPGGFGLQSLTVSASARVQLVNGTNRPVSVRAMTRDHIRLVAISRGLNLRMTDPATGAVSTEPVTVLLGLSQDEVDRTMHRLVLLEWAIGASAIAIAFVATTWGVQFSLRRLRTVTSTAQEVAAGLSPTGYGLDRRVEVDEPDTEVGQLATSMNTLLAAVETQFAARLASEERMRQFLADASHELRTPLTSIRGYAELSRMQGGQPASEADNLARIESEGTRMSRLVDDLLTLARTDQDGEREHRELEVGDVVADALEGVRAAHPHRRIDVTTEHGLVVLGDRDQLVRVVRNLATNAAVHTRADGPVRVSAAHEGPWVVLRVSDAGPGLPPEQAAHVFERFWRADKARSRAQGGSGLGLAIVAALVQSHGGDVRFDSTVEGGSTLTVRLPRAPR